MTSNITQLEEIDQIVVVIDPPALNTFCHCICIRICICLCIHQIVVLIEHLIEETLPGTTWDVPATNL